MSGITKRNIRAYVELADAEPGTYVLPVKLDPITNINTSDGAFRPDGNRDCPGKITVKTGARGEKAVMRQFFPYALFWFYRGIIC